MEKIVPIEYGCYYHIYNRGNNSENIFLVDKDYQHFLYLYDIYIPPIAETLAYCLMKNHFHLLVRIKEQHEIGYLEPIKPDDFKNVDISEKWKIVSPEKVKEYNEKGIELEKKPVPISMMSHLFNAYSKHFNSKNKRTGSLFEKNFHRKKVMSNRQLKNLVCYIHNNPVHHGFVKRIIDYPWSTYQAIISGLPSYKPVIDLFGSIEEFSNYHHWDEDTGFDLEFQNEKQDLP